MIYAKNFAHSCWAGEMMERIRIGVYVVFYTGEVAKVTCKYKSSDKVWELEFDRRVSQFKDRTYPKDYGSFDYSGARIGRCWYEHNNIWGLMDESEYQSYMAAVEKEEEEEREYKKRLEELKRKEEEERKAKEEAQKRAIIEKEVRAKLEAEYEAKLEAKLESELEKRMHTIVPDIPVSDKTLHNTQITGKQERKEAASQSIDTTKMMRNGLDKVLEMMKIRKQGGIAKLVEAAKTKADFEKCIALLKTRKQTGLAKQIEELLKDC